MFNAFVLNSMRAGFWAWHKLRGRVPRPAPPVNEVRRVLLFSTTGLGDSIIATPSFAGARQSWPQAEIWGVLHRRWADLFRPSPHFDRIVEYPGKFKGLNKLIPLLRGFAPDVALIIHGNDPDIVPLAYLSNPGFLAGWSLSRFNFLMDSRVDNHGPGRAYVEQFLDVVRAAAGPVQAEGEILFLDDQAKGRADDFWRSRGLTGPETLIALNPGGSNPAKQWPEKHWRELIHRLALRKGIYTALFGSPAEAGMMKRLTEDVDPARVTVVAQPKVGDVASLLGRAGVLIGPDSGMVHMAVALGIPVIVLFGPDDPVRSGPYLNRVWAEVLVSGPEVCPHVPGCRRKACVPNRCLEALTPEKVIEVLSSKLVM